MKLSCPELGQEVMRGGKSGEHEKNRAEVEEVEEVQGKGRLSISNGHHYCHRLFCR